MIYYFSGTGNSRHVAEVLGEKLGMSVVDLGERIRRGNMDDISDDTMIVVTPTYCYRMPRIVEDYVSGLQISAKSVYYVLTCGGSMGNAAHYAEALSKSIGVPYGDTFSVVMPENYIAMFKTPGVDESRAIIQKAEGKIDAIVRAVEKGERKSASSMERSIDFRRKRNLLQPLRQSETILRKRQLHRLRRVCKALCSR